MMESLRNNNNNNSDKEDGELSNDDDNNSIQERSFTVDSQHAGKRHRKKRSQVFADQSRNANRFKPRPMLRNHRHQQEDAGRYSYCSPAQGLRNGDAICQDDRQKLPERKTSTFPGQRRLLSSQERRISSPKRAFSSQRKYFPSRKRAHSSQKVAISSQMFKQRNLKSDTDTQDELRRLELEHEQIKQQLKMLDEEEEQSREQDDNEIQPSGYDSLLDVMEILNNLDEDIEDGKENISIPTALNRPPFLNKVEKEGSCKLPPQVSDIMMGLLMSQPNMSCSVVTPPERCDIAGNLHQEVLSVPPHDLTDLTTSLNVLNGLTDREKMPSAFSLSSDNERTASFTDPPKQIPVHFGSHRENKSGNPSGMRGKSAVNNHSIYTIYDAGISGRSTPKLTQTYGRGKRCSGKTSFCQPFPKKMKVSFLAAIPLLQNAAEVVSVSGNGCDSDEEDVESLRVKLLEDVQEKRKTVGECPANEIAPVHECADLDSSETSFVFDERVEPPVGSQEIVRLSPSVLSMSQEDINEDLCQNSSQLLNDHQEEQSPTELRDMKLTAEESSSKPQFMLQPLECLPSISVSTKNLLMDLKAAITTAVKTPRIVLEEIPDTVQKSPVVPLVIVDRYIQKASQRSTGSQEPEATEVETISTISSQKDIDESSCSPDGPEHRPSIKLVELSSTTDCLIKVDLEEYCAKQPEVVDTNVPFSQASSESSAESTAQLSIVESTAQLSPIESTAQLSPVESTAQLSPVESTAQLSPVESTAQLSPVESTAQLSPVESTAQLSPVESTAQLSIVESTAQISSVESTAEISSVESTAHISPVVEFTAQLSSVESTAQTSPVEHTVQISTIEATVQISTIETTVHLSPIESTAYLSSLESTAQLFPVESTALLSHVESTAQLFPVESTAQLFPFESTARLSPVESTAQLSPVESTAQLSPVESTALLSPVESTAHLSPVESTALLSPVESTAQLSHVESKAQLSPGEYTAWCNLGKSIAPLSTVENSAQLSLIDPTAQLSPAESTTQLNPVESTALVNPVESTALVNPVESTALVNPVESTALVNPVESTALVNQVESTAQLSPAKPVAQLSTGVCTAQMPLPRSTAQFSSASYETPHLTTCHASNNDPRNAAYSNNLQMSSLPEKPRRFKQPFMLPIHPPVIVPLSPSSDSDHDEDDDDQRQTQTQGVPNSIKAHRTLGGQDTGKPDNEDESGKQATQTWRDKEQRLASLEQSMQAHQKKVQLLTEKEADNANVLQLKKEELKNLFSQLITLKQEITNRNNLAIHYQAEIEKTQKEIQLLGKRKEHCQANKMRSELSESTADMATTTSPSACQSEVSRTDRNQSLSRAEERAQEKQKLMEREKTVKETLEKLKEEAAKKETRKFSTFISKRLRNTENKRKLLKINRIAKIHTLPQ